MISAQELADMRSTNEAWMPETMTWQVYTSAENNTAGRTQTWTPTNDPLTNQPTIPGRILEEVKAQELRDLGGEMIVGGRRSAFLVDTPVRINAKIKDRFVVQGKTYEVEEVLDHPTWDTANSFGCGLIP